MAALTLDVQVFGLFGFRCAGQAVALPASANARRLLTYLCLHRKPLSRLALAGKLWPEEPESKARHNLRQAIWNINRALPGLLHVDAEQVEIHPEAEIRLDCTEFEDLVLPYLQGQANWSEAARDLARAIELYQGDLLDGYYEDWAVLERERLYELYLQALQKLIVALKATLRYEQALAVALQLASENPLSESAHREAMRLHHYLGNPAAALKQYKICQEYLAQELGIQPAPETTQLAQAISQQICGQAADANAPFLPAPRPPQVDPALKGLSNRSLPLIGRRDERNTVFHWMQMEPGQGTLVLVEGEAGVGKTRLLQEAAADASWRGAQVLWSKVTESKDGGPLRPLVEAIESGLSPLRIEQLQHILEPLWLQVLQPLLPALLKGHPDLPGLLPTLNAEHARNRLLEALGCLFNAWSQISPLVIILEDIHWSDPDTLEALIRLPNYLETSPVTILASYRGEEIQWATQLAKIRPTSLRGRIKLVNLTPDESSRLIQTALEGAITPSFAGALFQETHGNPLFILEALRCLMEKGALRQNADGSWLSPYDYAGTDFELPLPHSVEQVILHRLEQLPPSLVETLQSLAVFARAFDFKQVACLGLTNTPGQLVAALQELAKRRLLVENAQGYHFQHDKIQQCIYQHIASSRRLELHAQIALALEASTPDQVELLAYHFDAGQQWDKALDYHRRAAEIARTSFAYASAGQHLQRALYAAAQGSADWLDVFHLHCEYNEVLDLLGNRPEQETNLAHMAALVHEDPLRLCQARLHQAKFLYSVNRFSEAETTARQAVELARNIQPSSSDSSQNQPRFVLAEALITLADILGWSQIGQHPQVGAVLIEAAQLCAQIESPALKARLHNSASFASYPIPPHTSRIEEAQQALALYQQLGDKAHEAEIACALGAFLQDSGAQLEQAAAYEYIALEIARSIGYRILEGRLLNNLANLEATRNLNQALEKLDQAAVIFRALNDERRASVSLLNAANYRLLLLGDVPATQPAIQYALQYSRRTSDLWVEGYALLLSGLAARQQRDWNAARRWLNQALEVFQTSNPAWLQTRAYMALAQVEHESGCLENALVQIEAAIHIAEPASFDHQIAFLQALHAMVLLQSGQLEQAERLSCEAMKAWVPSMEYAWEIPFARYQILNARQQTNEAALALEQAYQALEKMLYTLAPEQRILSLQRIWQHGAILKAWQAGQPCRQRVRLLSSRPTNGAGIEVTWTISAPEDAGCSDKVSLRRYRLARLLREAQEQGVEPTQQQLADILGVSLRTISKDMTFLASSR